MPQQSPSVTDANAKKQALIATLLVDLLKDDGAGVSQNNTTALLQKIGPALFSQISEHLLKEYKTKLQTITANHQTKVNQLVARAKNLSRK